MTNPTDETAYRASCPPLNRPADFGTFWAQTLQELAGIDIDYHIHHSHAHAPALTEQWFSYPSLGQLPITAYGLLWDDDTPRPLVVYTHGYAGQCEVMLNWARQGINVIGFDLRGMGRSKTPLLSLAPDGYILTGLESAEQSILRGVVCDFIRACEVALHGLRVNPERIIFHGLSFGGAISLMAAALTELPDLLVSGVPTLGWAEGRRQLVRRGSGQEINQYLQQHPQQEKTIMQTLAYFDSMNFADRLVCPSLVGIGAHDEVVPAATVYAIINHMHCPLEIRELPVSHSEQPQEALWQMFESEWLQLARNGVPEDFGQANTRLLQCLS